LSVSARWVEGREHEIQPFADEADRHALLLLEDVLAGSPSLDGVPKTVQDRVLAAAPTLFSRLWTAVRAEADEEALRATRELEARGRAEAQALRNLLFAQRMDVQRSIARLRQTELDFGETEREQERQLQRDLAHLEARYDAIAKEASTEPAQIEALYQVALRRLEPVGLVVLWPETRL